MTSDREKARKVAKDLANYMINNFETNVVFYPCAGTRPWNESGEPPEYVSPYLDIHINAVIDIFARRGIIVIDMGAWDDCTKKKSTSWWYTHSEENLMALARRIIDGIKIALNAKAIELAYGSNVETSKDRFDTSMRIPRITIGDNTSNIDEVMTKLIDGFQEDKIWKAIEEKKFLIYLKDDPTYFEANNESTERGPERKLLATPPNQPPHSKPKSKPPTPEEKKDVEMKPVKDEESDPPPSTIGSLSEDEEGEEEDGVDDPIQTVSEGDDREKYKTVERRRRKPDERKLERPTDREPASREATGRRLEPITTEPTEAKPYTSGHHKACIEMNSSAHRYKQYTIPNTQTHLTVEVFRDDDSRAEIAS